MRPLILVLGCITALSSVGTGCMPRTILSARSIKEEPARVYEQVASALRPEYQCEDGTDEVTFAARCKSKRGGIAIEVRRKAAPAILALRFWVTHPQCGSPEMLTKAESFSLEDAAGGTRAYCIENRLVLAFETYLPAAGVEPSELVQLVTAWEKNASTAAQRHGLFATSAE